MKYNIYKKDQLGEITPTRHKDLEGELAQKRINQLNAWVRKYYPNLVEAGYAYVAIPVKPKATTEGKYKFCVYSNIGFVVLLTNDLTEVQTLVNDHEDYTWEEVA